MVELIKNTSAIEPYITKNPTVLVSFQEDAGREIGFDRS
jgi:hypothetical protein